MILDRVAITGADNSIKPEDLIPLTQRFPFVEWAILLSKSQEGGRRFPSLDWMERLSKVRSSMPQMKLAGHLCGRWVREFCAGNHTFVEDRPSIVQMFDRIQVNFHAIVHTTTNELIQKALLQHPRKAQFIFQLDDVNNEILRIAQENGFDAVPLFDLSGGAGKLPSDWPKPSSHYSGYAGGLSPDNVAEQIKKIQTVAQGNRIWIDVERRVRSEDDSQFDLAKVTRFLEQAEPFVHQ